MKEIYMSPQGPLGSPQRDYTTPSQLVHGRRELERGPDGRWQPAPQLPKVELSTEAIGLMVDHLVGVPATFKKPITYCITADGQLFEVRKNRIGVVARKPTEVHGAQGKLQEGFQMVLPKVPFEMLGQTVNFFRGVCERHKQALEALVQFWWDPATSSYFIHVPEHEVSGASVHYTGNFDPGGDQVHVMDIHSHGSMNAFFSGTDDTDESRAERLYGVVGQVAFQNPPMLFRFRTSGAFVMLTVDQVFEMPAEGVVVKVPFAAILGTLDIKGAINPFHGIEVPDAWFDQVKVRSHQSVMVIGSFRGHHYSSLSQAELIEGAYDQIPFGGASRGPHSPYASDDYFRVTDTRRVRPDAHLGALGDGQTPSAPSTEFPIDVEIEGKRFLGWRDGTLALVKHRS